jgi:hypothetical protein
VVEVPRFFAVAGGGEKLYRHAVLDEQLRRSKLA